MKTRTRHHLALGAVVLALWASAGAAQAAFPGINGKIAFTSKGEIYVMNADGSDRTNLTQHPDLDEAPAWSPDGSKIVFHRFQTQGVNNREIYVMNADGSGQTNLTQHPAHDSSPAWSPDGSKIAFTSDRDGNDEVYVMNADGSGQTNLTQASTHEGRPAWSPDGSKIAFQSSRVDTWEIYTMNADGSDQINLTQDPRDDTSPAWSPDGSKIAFHSFRSPGDPDIYVMNADGTGQTNLTQAAGYDDSPAWSPDGSKIAFHREGALSVDIYVMNADGSDQTNLTADSGGGGEPDWQPLPDEDGDGIPDDEDVEETQEAIAGLPASAFKGGDNGHRSAMHNILNAVERAVAAGDTEEAIAKLQTLRRRVDGCGLVADLDDWIVDCAAQLEIRQQIDTLITNLSS